MIKTQMNRRTRQWAMSLLVVLGLSVQPSAVAAQSGECVFPLTVVLSEQVAAQLSVANQTQLESKVRQIVTHSGMTGGQRYSNFFIMANLTEDSKNLTAGLRPLVTVILDLELSVGNSVTGDRYAATAIRLSGAGPNERRAYTAAISGINSAQPQLQQFMKQAHQKIANYYETQTSNIIRKARDFAAKQNYDEAFFLLTSVPTCVSKYPDVEQATLSIFQQYVDLDCSSKLAKARAAWAASQDREGARQAGAYLSAIHPASTCTEDAQTLIDQISQRIGEEWEWAKDLKEFGKEMSLHAVDIEKMRIEAARAIGEAWGNNQQPHTLIQNQSMEAAKGGQQQMAPVQQQPVQQQPLPDAGQ